MVHKIKHYGFIIFIAVTAILVFTLVNGGYYGTRDLLLPFSIGAALIISLTLFSEWYPANLTKRIAADAPIRWVLRMNSVEVGRVTDAQYATMQLQAIRNRGNALAQVKNLGSVAVTILDRLVIGVPAMFFWGFLTLALWSPDFFMAIVREILSGDTASNLSFIRFLLLFTVMVCLASFFLLLLFGVNFGFVNYYSEALNRMLRHEYNIPDEGVMHLHRMVHDDLAATAKSN